MWIKASKPFVEHSNDNILGTFLALKNHLWLVIDMFIRDEHGL